MVEEIANLGKDARAMGNGVVHGGAEGLAQSFTALLTALRRQAGQVRREMIVAGHDDPNDW